MRMCIQNSFSHKSKRTVLLGLLLLDRYNLRKTESQMVRTLCELIHNVIHVISHTNQSGTFRQDG